MSSRSSGDRTAGSPRLLFEAYVVALHRLHGLAQVLAEEVHYGVYLLARALPIFRRKRVDREIFYAYVLAIRGDAGGGVSAPAAWPAVRGEAAFFSPAAVKPSSMMATTWRGRRASPVSSAFLVLNMAMTTYISKSSFSFFSAIFSISFLSSRPSASAYPSRLSCSRPQLSRRPSSVP